MPMLHHQNTGALDGSILASPSPTEANTHPSISLGPEPSRKGWPGSRESATGDTLAVPGVGWRLRGSPSPDQHTQWCQRHPARLCPSQLRGAAHTPLLTLCL